METVLNLLLIRFAVIAVVLVGLTLLLFTAALAIRRRGGGDQLIRYARTAARITIDRLGDDRAPHPRLSRRRHWLVDAAFRALARSLADDREHPDRRAGHR